MNPKKALMLFIGILLFSLISGQGNKMEVSVTKETFKPGENITFIISLYDSENKLIENQVNVTFKNIEKGTAIEKKFLSKKLVNADLGRNSPAGEWRIIAEYNEVNLSVPRARSINE